MTLDDGIVCPGCGEELVLEAALQVPIDRPGVAPSKESWEDEEEEFVLLACVDCVVQGKIDFSQLDG